MARAKHIVGWISVVLLVVTLASIWMLTEQSVEQTSSLSESTAHVVEGQSASVRPETAGETQAGDAVGDAGSTTATVHPDPLAPVRLWMGANIRRVAHTVEFFFVGLTWVSMPRAMSPPCCWCCWPPCWFSARPVPLAPMRDVNLKMENHDRLHVGAGYNIGIGRRWPSMRCLPDTCLF